MVSRPGLGDRPLFVVGVGGQYAVRIKLAMGDFAGRIPLMVEGVSTMRLELGAYDSDPTTLQVPPPPSYRTPESRRNLQDLCEEAGSVPTHDPWVNTTPRRTLKAA